MIFSRREIRDLVNAWLLTSLVFAIAFTGLNTFYLQPTIFLIAFFISALTAGVGFLLHELMHKKVAQGYGLRAEFVAFYNYLFFAIVLAIFGFIFIAPGAVMIHGLITREKNGKISVAGPITNVVLAIIFLIPLLIFQMPEIVFNFFKYGLLINGLLGAFNMIPFGPLDGRKVFVWNKIIWTTVTLAAVILTFIGFRL